MADVRAAIVEVACTGDYKMKMTFELTDGHIFRFTKEVEMFAIPQLGTECNPDYHNFREVKQVYHKPNEIVVWLELDQSDKPANLKRHQRERCWIVADAMPRVEPMGRNLPGGWREPKQVAWNAHRQAVCEPGFLGKPDGMGDRMDRNRAIGNGQDPRVAAAAWRLLTANVELTGSPQAASPAEPKA